MIRCVVLDFDGTLVDSNPLKRQAYFDAAAECGIARDLVPAAIAAQPGADRFGVMRELAGRARPTGAAEEVEKVCGELVRAYARICEHGQATLPERPGATAALGILAPAMPLYVNSATPGDSLARAVERRGWSQRFRAVLGRPASKEENLRAIIASEGLPAAAVAMVGDDQRDRDSARAVGCPFFGVRSRGGDLEDDGTLLADLVGLPALIQAVR